MTLAPLPGAVDKAPAPEFTLRLADERGEGTREIQSRNGTAVVPAGTYWLIHWTITTQDAGGRTWTARGGVVGMPPALTHLRFTAGQRVQLPLGPPLGAEVTPVVQGRTLKLRMGFSGVLGDRCYEVKVDGERPPRPALKIVDAEGKEVDRLSFAFG